MSENVTSEENTKKTVGFKVSAHEYNVLQHYAQYFTGHIIILEDYLNRYIVIILITIIGNIKGISIMDDRINNNRNKNNNKIHRMKYLLC